MKTIGAIGLILCSVFSSSLGWSKAEGETGKSCVSVTEQMEFLLSRQGDYVADNSEEWLEIYIDEETLVTSVSARIRHSVSFTSNDGWNGEVGLSWVGRASLVSSQGFFSGNTTTEWRRETGVSALEDNVLKITRKYSSKRWYQWSNSRYKIYKTHVTTITFLENGDALYHTSEMDRWGKKAVLFHKRDLH